MSSPPKIHFLYSMRKFKNLNTHTHTHNIIERNWFWAMTMLNIFTIQTSTLKPIDIHGSWLSPLEKKFLSNQWINVLRENHQHLTLIFYDGIIKFVVVGMDIISIVFSRNFPFRFFLVNIILLLKTIPWKRVYLCVFTTWNINCEFMFGVKVDHNRRNYSVIKYSLCLFLGYFSGFCFF